MAQFKVDDIRFCFLEERQLQSGTLSNMPSVSEALCLGLSSEGLSYKLKSLLQRRKQATWCR